MNKSRSGLFCGGIVLVLVFFGRVEPFHPLKNAQPPKGILALAAAVVGLCMVARCH